MRWERMESIIAAILIPVSDMEYQNLYRIPLTKKLYSYVIFKKRAAYREKEMAECLLHFV